MEIKKQILSAVEEIVENAGLMLIDLSIRGNVNNRIVEVFIDSEESVTTKLCSEISREIGDRIEAEEIITSKYRLDVSSPGIDRPLKFLRQFKKNINRQFEVKFEEDGEKKKIKGELSEITDDKLTFKVNKEIKIIDFSNIKSAKVLIRF